MKNEQLLSDITDYCRREGMAESTFGRRAVNDGKLVPRLREGRRITVETLDRIRKVLGEPTRRSSVEAALPLPPEPPLERRDPKTNFRFFENRQKYLLFVHTCSEKRVIAQRVALELSSIHPRPPAVRLFDAGMGDGTVLSRVMRAMHARFPHLPFYVAGKEISYEDVRLTIEKGPGPSSIPPRSRSGGEATTYRRRPSVRTIPTGRGATLAIALWIPKTSRSPSA